MTIHGTVKAVIDGIGPHIAGHDARIKSLEAENVALKAVNTMLKADLAEFRGDLAVIKAKLAVIDEADPSRRYAGAATSRLLS